MRNEPSTQKVRASSSHFCGTANLCRSLPTTCIDGTIWQQYNIIILHQSNRSNDSNVACSMVQQLATEIRYVAKTIGEHDHNEQ